MKYPSTLRLVLGGIFLGWCHLAIAETMVVDNLALACGDKQLFSNLMIMAKEGGNAWIVKAIDQVDQGNCRWLEKGAKVSVKEHDGKVLILVHEIGDLGPYWTSSLFFH